MREIVSYYVLGLVVGVILGFIFPAYVSWRMFFGAVLIVIIGTGVVGRYVLGHTWSGYLSSVYALVGGPLVLVCVGALLGAGCAGIPM